MSQHTPFPDPFEFLRKLWGPMGLPLAGMAPPLLDPQEIDKRIADLRNVEMWLGMNLNVLRMTIQGLEMQRSTAQAFQAMQAPSAAVKGAPGAPVGPSGLQQSMASAAEAWWSLLQQQTAALAPGPEPKKPR